MALAVTHYLSYVEMNQNDFFNLTQKFLQIVFWSRLGTTVPQALFWPSNLQFF